MQALLEKLISDIQWEPIEAIAPAHQSSELHPTHRGVLKIDQFELHCYQSSNGDIAFDMEDLDRFMRGCPFCDHPSQCPGCNPTTEERCRPRVGLMLE